jgi:catalase
VLEAVEAENEPLTGTLRLGVILTIGPFLLPAVLPPLRRAYPKLRLNLVEDLTDRLIEQLHQGKLDAVLLALPYDCGNVEIRILFEDRFRAALRRRHPLAAASQQGIQNLDEAATAAIISGDRESHQRDLYEAIERKEFPRWAVKIQVMSEAEAAKTPYNPFDLTKVWPHKDFPLIEVGVLELNRNRANYFAEVEQASFSPANVVPGVSHSPDKMLQFRIFSYADAHRYRLGVNYESLPVNRPRCPVHNYHRDGAMRFDGNEGGAVNYEPNSFGGPQQDHAFREPPLPITGDADRHDHRAGNDDYSQAGNLFRLMSAAQKKLLIAALVGAMRGVPVEIQKRQIAHFAKADPAYGAGVAEGLGLKVTEAAAE